MKSLKVTDITGDDRQLRGELVAIIKNHVLSVDHHISPLSHGRSGTLLSLSSNTMFTRHARAGALLTEIMNQVMIYSITAPKHIRVLEAYFNDKNLIVRQTKVYDMRQHNRARIDLLIRWWMGFAR
jgi:hypothetical protein